MLIEIKGHIIIKDIYEKTNNETLKDFCEQTFKVFNKKYSDLKYW